VFSGNIPPPNVWDTEAEEDEIEEIDFHDVGKFFGPLATPSKTTIPKRKTEFVPVENTTVHDELIIRNGNLDTRPLPAKIVDKTLSPPNGIGIGTAAQSPVNGSHLFYVDTQPSDIPNGLEVFTIQPSSELPADDEDVIVYDAPHPRNNLRMSGREKETTEDVSGVSTTNNHGPVAVNTSGFSSYKRPAALPSLVSHAGGRTTFICSSGDSYDTAHPGTTFLIRRIYCCEVDAGT
jgi:hypothetical protein